MTPPAARGGAMLLPRGQLAENVLHFVRVLRTAGLPVGPAKVIDAIAAVEAVGVAQPDRLPRGARRGAGVAARAPAAVRAGVRSLLAQPEAPREDGRRAAAARLRPHRRGAAAARSAGAARAGDAAAEGAAGAAGEEDEVELDAAFTFSAREVLQKKDFATMTTDELAQVKAMLARLKLPLPERPQRRTRPSRAGTRVDLRATLRGMTGAAGAVAPLAYRARVRRPPPLVVLCDISGSMDRYARMLLHFLHAITNDRHRVQHARVRHAAHQHHAPSRAPRRRRGARAASRPRSTTGPAARASARASPSSTAAGRGACSARTPSCC